MLPGVGQHRQLAALGRDHLAVDEDEVAEVDVGLPGGQRVGADPVEREHHLQFDAVLAQRREAELAGVADEDDPAGDADVVAGLRVRGEVGVASRGPRPASACAAPRPGRARRCGSADQPVVLPGAADRCSLLAARSCIVAQQSVGTHTQSALAARDTDECHRPIRRGEHCPGCRCAAELSDMTTRHPAAPSAGHRPHRPDQVLPDPAGPVQAVARRRHHDRARARPSPCSARTAPASRRRSTCCSACCRPTPAQVQLFGMPAAAGDRGRARSARCCRSAASLRDLTRARAARR